MKRHPPPPTHQHTHTTTTATTTTSDSTETHPGQSAAGQLEGQREEVVGPRLEHLKKLFVVGPRVVAQAQQSSAGDGEGETTALPVSADEGCVAPALDVVAHQLLHGRDVAGEGVVVEGLGHAFAQEAVSLSGRHGDGLGA